MGVSERKEKEKEIRRNDIIDAAEKVFFSKGYDLATMDDVAKTAEFSKRTIYVYFNSKEQIYFEIMIRGYKLLISMIDEYVSNSKDDGITKVRKLGEVFFCFSKHHPNYFYAIMNYENGELDFSSGIPDKSREQCYELGEIIFQYLSDFLEQGIREKIIREDIDIKSTAILLWSFTVGIFTTLKKKKNYIVEVHHKSVDELLEVAFNMLTKTIEK
ncbi:TetR/AcrR family transcriptional regulator [Clostridium manihotivorum]|uniref:TetR/AcrR family transcriptional regulator n=1 Tax=Clostridium manihotivorum TaxID=2320868 RepID=A0A410DTQ5_9CLOT|nr:TetR/AcrR family transcriptional regulator [Clostridium manihotivorum]QAA32465.1 TetR/AcrR family transcriptional regulator [Clostridium manihotivorum]